MFNVFQIIPMKKINLIHFLMLYIENLQILKVVSYPKFITCQSILSTAREIELFKWIIIRTMLRLEFETFGS